MSEIMEDFERGVARREMEQIITEIAAAGVKEKIILEIRLSHARRWADKEERERQETAYRIYKGLGS